MKKIVIVMSAAALTIGVMAQTPTPSATSSPTLLKEFRPIGGGGNNLKHPSWNPVPGAAELAIAPLNFAPHTNNGLVNGPNVRLISNLIAGGTGLNGINGATEDPTATAWLYVFGQFLDHDLGLESTPPTTAAINIVVPTGDPLFTPGTTMAMTRDERNPTSNTIINTTAGFLDLSQLYGSTTAVASSLRNSDGTLKSSDNGQALPVQNELFITGDPRVMENPELSAVTILFMREHNYWVGRLANIHPNWTGDQLYNMAKAITTAEYQNIVYKEYLPLLLGPVLGQYRGYNPDVNAQETQEFSAAAFRMGHSEISDTQTGLDNAGNVTFTQSLADAFFNTASIDEANGIDSLIRGVTADGALATDPYCVGALRNLLFAGLVGGDIDEIDLIAIDIQRERDVGLASLNGTRRALGFQPYRSFSQVTRDPVLAANLQTVFGSVDNLDLFMGGLAEDHSQGALVGPTFREILARQFQSLRDGDRFFWRNQGFDSRTANMISNTTLGELITRNTDTTDAPANVFRIGNPDTRRPPFHAPQPRRVDNHGRRLIWN